MPVPSKRGKEQQQGEDFVQLRELARGAEALVTLNRRTRDNTLFVTKQRVRKSYRIEKFDTIIRKKRTKKEVKALEFLKEHNFNVPTVIDHDPHTFSISMSYIADCVSVKDFVQKFAEGQHCDIYKVLYADLGRLAAKLHAEGFCHGDLTGSNILITNSDTVVQSNGPFEFTLIDFGLSSRNASDEDAAVELYVLERSLAIANPKLNQCFEDLKTAYVDQRGSDAVLNRYKKVVERGRKKEMIG